MKIKVISEMCGTGKSSYILNEMLQWQKDKVYDQFVYISPLLSEVGGAKDEDGSYLTGRVQEVCKSMDFKFPKAKSSGGKSEHVRELLLDGKNISATHSLFLGLEEVDIELFRERNNILVIDEAVSAFQEFTEVSRQGIELLLTNENLIVDDDNVVSWNHIKFPVDVEAANPKFGGRPFEYKELVQLCNRGHVHLVQGRVVIWEFPVSVLDAFDEVYVLTYLFEGSFMSSWCKLNDIGVEYVEPSLYRSTEEVKAFIKSSVEVASAPPLKPLDKYTYSYTWWSEASNSKIDKVNTSLASYIKNYLKGYTYEDYLFTYPKFLRGDGKKKPLKIKGRGFTKADWLAVQTRATNDYADKKVIFYLYDRYPNTTLVNFCASKGCNLDKDSFAVGELIQLLWRGCARKGEPMVVIIPSKRMRRLFNDWLENKGVFSGEG